MSFSREEAKEFANQAIDRIYDQNPTRFSLELRAAVDEIPEYTISYDGYAVLVLYKKQEDSECGS